MIAAPAPGAVRTLYERALLDAATGRPAVLALRDDLGREIVVDGDAALRVTTTWTEAGRWFATLSAS